MRAYSPDGEYARIATLIRPILRGRDTKRYGYHWAELWIVYLPWHFPLQFDNTIQGALVKALQEQYPAVHNHMLQYKMHPSKQSVLKTYNPNGNFLQFTYTHKCKIEV